MKIKSVWILYILRALLIISTLLVLAFIFSNAVATGEDSSKQSTEITVKVQEVVAVIAPNSPIATASGEDFDVLHSFVRTLAHFAEYALLGACSFGTFLSFMQKGRWRYAFFTPAFLALTAAVDEFAQSLTAGRAAQFADFTVDCLGSACGMAVALLVYGLVVLILNKKKGECL